MTTRLKFSEFNPYAFLSHQHAHHAKPAKAAKLAVNNAQTLAGLASLAPTIANQSKSIVKSEWNADDWQAYFDERAGIAEYDGGLSHIDAEIQARNECVTRWLQLNPPAPSNPDTCLHCDQQFTSSSVNVINPAGRRARLHDECLPIWRANRWEQALAALRVIGVLIATPPILTSE
jgi:hypothetical protein